LIIVIPGAGAGAGSGAGAGAGAGAGVGAGVGAGFSLAGAGAGAGAGVKMFKFIISICKLIFFQIIILIGIVSLLQPAKQNCLVLHIISSIAIIAIGLYFACCETFNVGKLTKR
jgi:hypothetical protein